MIRRHIISNNQEISLDLQETEPYKRLEEFCLKIRAIYRTNSVGLANGTIVTAKIFCADNGEEIVNQTRWFPSLGGEESLSAMSFILLEQLGVQHQSVEKEEQELIEDAQDVLSRGMEKIFGSELGIENCEQFVEKIAEIIERVQDEQVSDETKDEVSVSSSTEESVKATEYSISRVWQLLEQADKEVSWRRYFPGSPSYHKIFEFLKTVDFQDRNPNLFEAIKNQIEYNTSYDFDNEFR